MTKFEYLQELEKNLQSLPEAERVDILADFEEHFTYALSNGKTEDEICGDLGDPKENAAQYISGAEAKPAEQLAVIPQAQANTLPKGTPKAKSSDNSSLYLALFIVALLFAIGIYSSCIPVAIGGVSCVVVAIGLIPLLNGLLIGVIISAGVFILGASVLVMLLITWLCMWLYKKYKACNAEVKG